MSHETTFDYSRLKHTATLLKNDGFDNRKETSRGRVDFELYMNLPPQQGDLLLEQKTIHLTQGTEILNTDGEPYDLFNDHTKRHLMAVHKHMDAILGKSVDPTTLSVANAMRRMHDWGNNLSRKNHGQWSAALFPRIFTNFSYEDPRVISILLGAYLHDEHNGIQLSPENYGQIAPEYFPSAIRALIIADKADIGRHRLPLKFLEMTDDEAREVVDVMPHIVLSIFVKNTNIGFSETEYGKTMTIEEIFSSTVSTHDDPEVQEILKRLQWRGPSDPDLWAGEKMYALFKNPNSTIKIPYSDSVRAHQKGLYAARQAMLLSCAFAEFPDLEEVRVQMVDNNPLIEETGMTRYKRETWPAVSFFAWKSAQGLKSIQIKRDKVPPILRPGYDMYMGFRKNGHTLSD